MKKVDFVALSVERVKINEDINIIKPTGVIEGTLLNNIFYEKTGRIFYSLRAMDKKSYCYEVEIDKLKSAYKNDSIDDVYLEYFFNCNKDILLEVFDADNGEHRYVTIPDADKTLTDEEILQKLESKKNTIKKEESVRIIKKEIKVDLREVYTELKKDIIGQDDAIKKISVAVVTHYLSDNPKIKANIFVTGSTGVGKTQVFSSLGKIIDVPVCIEDATQQSKIGYVGDSVTDMLRRLYELSDCDLNIAENGILVVDEIDKKISKEDDVSGTVILDSLLKLKEGGVYTIKTRKGPINFNTSNLVFAGLGSFQVLRQNKKQQVGFIKNDNESIINEALDNGLPPEFYGRDGIVIEMKDLNCSDLERILKESRLSKLNSYIMFFKQIGVDLKYSDEFISSVSNKAYKLKTGARSLNRILEECLEDAKFEILWNMGKYHELVVNGDTVTDSKKFILK